MFFVYGGNIVAMFTFHTSHMITKSRRWSIKEVVHANSFINCRAIWDLGKI